MTADQDLSARLAHLDTDAMVERDDNALEWALTESYRSGQLITLADHQAAVAKTVEAVEAERRERAKIGDGIAGNTADFGRDHRRAAALAARPDQPAADAVAYLHTRDDGQSKELVLSERVNSETAQRRIELGWVSVPLYTHPQPAADTRVVAAALWREEAVNAGAPDSVAAGRTLASFSEQSHELQARWTKFASCAIRAIIGNATPAPSDKIAEAARVPEVAALVEAAQLCSDWDEWAYQTGGICPDRLVNCMGKLRAALSALAPFARKGGA